ncbi:MAG: MBL fold metallo-hydrolase [Bacteroidetes bacterium]|nr:MBL fold metallo-hydrolase [Bacteroidota bacterium]MCL5027373.1 MBL fold metallo-hydrolase [Chloroflexota bacterium]
MDIQWLGHSCFRIRGKETTIVVDPFPKNLGYSIGRPAADILLVTHDHPNHSNVSAVAGEPFLIDGPGEYEVSGVFITGVPTFHDGDNGRRRGKNTVYLIEADDLVICHLGDLGHVLTPAQVEQMSQVDILFVPVGGRTTINAAQASELVSLLEPRIVVPMHFRTEVAPIDLDPVDRFLREMGSKAPAAQPKLVVNRASLPAETQVVLLEYPKR